MLLPVLAYVLVPDVSAAWLPHIQRVLAIVVVVLHHAVHAVSHLSIQLLCYLVARAHEEVDEPRLVRIRGFLERIGETRRVAEATRRGCDGERGDVAVPGEVVRVGVGVGVVRRLRWWEG